MRRIIPYIASYFQNDRIWLRRVKPSKRDYQVLIAVDDSASMNENECNQVGMKGRGRRGEEVEMEKLKCMFISP